MNQHHADMLVHKSLLEITAESSKEHNISPRKMLEMLLSSSSHPFNGEEILSPPGIIIEALYGVVHWPHLGLKEPVSLWFRNVTRRDGSSEGSLPLSWDRIRKILKFYFDEINYENIASNSTLTGFSTTDYEIEMKGEAEKIHKQQLAEKASPLGTSQFLPTTIHLETEFFEKYFLNEESVSRCISHNRFLSDPRYFWDCDAPNYWTAIFNRRFHPRGDLSEIYTQEDAESVGELLNSAALDAVSVSEYLENKKSMSDFLNRKEKEERKRNLQEVVHIINREIKDKVSDDLYLNLMKLVKDDM